MKKILYVVLLCLSMLSSVLMVRSLSKPQPKSVPQVSIQRKATHLVLFKGRNDDDDIGACTATVVAPHAISLAEHCDIGAGASDTISLDLATNVYHVQKRWKDGRDHIVYGLDGDAFGDISPIKERPAKAGEYVYYYGDPQAAYPPQLYTGIVKYNHDPSELTRKSGMQYYSLDSEPGCSGSTVYAADGSMVGMITYGDSEDELGGLYRKTGSIGFELNYSKKQLAEISKFAPPKHSKRGKPLPPPRDLFPF